MMLARRLFLLSSLICVEALIPHEMKHCVTLQAHRGEGERMDAGRVCSPFTCSPPALLVYRLTEAQSVSFTISHFCMQRRHQSEGRAAERESFSLTVNQTAQSICFFLSLKEGWPVILTLKPFSTSTIDLEPFVAAKTWHNGFLK